MRRWGWFVITLLAGGVLFAMFGERSPTPSLPNREAPVAATSEAPVAAPVAAAVVSDPAPPPSVEADPPLTHDPTRLAMIRSDATLMERANQLELAAEADARWNEAVDRGGFGPDDFDPAVRDLFASMRLEPRYLEAGAIDGLVIEEMPSDHPLAAAGFRVGDRLSRIQGIPLDDPAALPSLLSHLGPHISFCAERGEEERCEEVDLE